MSVSATSLFFTMLPARIRLGQPTRVVAAQAMGAFDVAEELPAKTRGTVFHNPDMRQWNSDSGMISRFTWRG